MEQIRFVTHKLYSENMYNEAFLPFGNGNYYNERIIHDMLNYLHNEVDCKREQVLDSQDMKTKLTTLT